MMNGVTKTEERRPNPVAVFRDEFGRLEGQIKAALPEHVSVERFMRIVTTAVLGNRDLMGADRKTLYEAAIRAAQDGLMPDGREGALVIFGGRVQWMPMIGGIYKKLRNSGDVAWITAHVVYGGDHYRFWVDDKGEHVEYEPAENPDTETIRLVFAAATLKDGTLYVEPMRPDEVEKVRSVSRSGSKGPWTDWWTEMARKTAVRRLAKRLPLSAENMELLTREDAMYDLAREPARPATSGLAARLQGVRGPGFNRGQIERIVSGDETPALDHDDIQRSPASDAPQDASEAGEAAESGDTSSGSPADTSPAPAGDAADRSVEGDDLPSPEEIAARRAEDDPFDFGFKRGKGGRLLPDRDPEWGDDEWKAIQEGHDVGKRVRAAEAAKAEG